MYICIIGNDPKFPPLVRRFFEAAHSGNVIYCILASSGLGATSVLCDPNEKAGYILIRDLQDVKKVFCDVDRLDGVILCGVLPNISGFIDSIPDSVKVSWFIWGHEVYDTLARKGFKLFGDHTKQFVEAGALNKFKSKLRPWSYRFIQRESCRRKAIRRVDNFVSLIPGEFSLLKKIGYLRSDCRYFRIPNMPLEYFVDTSVHSATRCGVDILVGNSASPTNNHIEIFTKLSEFNLDGRRVIVPLNYGDKNYRDFVIQSGKRILGKSFFPLVEFFPLNEYNELISSCSVVIMNHYRQQALGNILLALWNGAETYLASSILIDAFSNRGLLVRDVSQLDLNRIPSKEENEKYAKINRPILKSEVGESTSVKSLRELLNR